MRAVILREDGPISRIEEMKGDLAVALADRLIALEKGRDSEADDGIGQTQAKVTDPAP